MKRTKFLRSYSHILISYSLVSFIISRTNGIYFSIVRKNISKFYVFRVLEILDRKLVKIRK